MGETFSAMSGARTIGAERSKDCLFVYGTLLDAARLDAVLGGVTAWRDAGPATVAGILYDAGEFPALRLCADPRRRVPGRLIEFAEPAAALARIDVYEDVAGTGGLFARTRCRVRLARGGTTAAWVYVYVRRVRGLRRIAQWPPSPD